MDAGTFGFARRGGDKAVHDEETFRYLLAIERARAARANRPLQVLLVSSKPHVTTNPLRSPTFTAALFSSMASSLREIDLIGWLREGRIAGAVLAQDREPAPDAAREVAARIARFLDAGVAREVRIRAIKLQGPSRC